MKPICVTERAAEHLKEVLVSRAQGPNRCLRLELTADWKVALTLDERRDEDQMIEADGMAILLIHPALAAILEGTTLDYVDAPEGPQLILGN